jgi:hypothetical protein
MQGVYPVPVELMADVMAATMDEFEYLDRIYGRVPMFVEIG